MGTLDAKHFPKYGSILFYYNENCKRFSNEKKAIFQIIKLYLFLRSLQFFCLPKVKT